MMIARVRRASPACCARMQASMIGTEKHIDLPEPVPVVTTRLWFAGALPIDSTWWRQIPKGPPFLRTTLAVSARMIPSAESWFPVEPCSNTGFMDKRAAGQNRPAAYSASTADLMSEAWGVAKEQVKAA